MGFRLKLYTKLPLRRDGITTSYLIKVIKNKGHLPTYNRQLTVSEQHSCRVLHEYAAKNNYHFDVRQPNIMLDGNTLIFTDPFISYKREEHG